MAAAKQVHIVQGTPVWHEWRRKGTGASDVSALFGKNPYKTERDLFFEKAGFGEPDDEDRSYIFNKGHENELTVRSQFYDQTKIELNPTCFEKDEIFLSSLDGYEQRVGILEAKFVGLEVLKKAAKDGEIPEHHWIQIQAQLHGTDEDKGFWGGRAPKAKDTVVVEIGRDEKFILDIRRKVTAFWERLAKNEAPPLSKDDFLFLNAPKDLQLFRELQALKAQLDAADAAYSKVEQAVKKLAAHPKVRCGDVTITETERKGSIDFLAIPEVKALPEEALEMFRKKSSVYKTIRYKREG